MVRNNNSSCLQLTSTWTQDAEDQIPEHRTQAAGCRIDSSSSTNHNRFIVTGGRDVTGEATATAWMITNKRTTTTTKILPDLLIPRYSHGCIVDEQNNYVYVMGGYNWSGRMIKSVEVLDLQHPSRGWKMVKAMPHPRAPLVVECCVNNGNGRRSVYLMGGSSASVVDCYHLDTNQWESLYDVPALPVPDAWIAGSTVVSRRYICLIGEDTPVTGQCVMALDISTERWVSPRNSIPSLQVDPVYSEALASIHYQNSSSSSSSSKGRGGGGKAVMASSSSYKKKKKLICLYVLLGLAFVAAAAAGVTVFFILSNKGDETASTSTTTSDEDDLSSTSSSSSMVLTKNDGMPTPSPSITTVASDDGSGEVVASSGETEVVAVTTTTTTVPTFSPAVSTQAPSFEPVVAIKVPSTPEPTVKVPWWQQFNVGGGGQQQQQQQDEGGDDDADTIQDSLFVGGGSISEEMAVLFSQESGDPGSNDPCSVCGPDKFVGAPRVVFTYPGRSDETCGALETRGFAGDIGRTECLFLAPVIEDDCACTLFPTMSPSDIPTFTPSVSPTTSPPSSEPSESQLPTTLSCSVCGEGRQVSADFLGVVWDPDNNFDEVVGPPGETCGELEERGYDGFVTITECRFYPTIVLDACDCQDVPTSSPSATPTTPSATPTTSVSPSQQPTELPSKQPSAIPSISVLPTTAPTSTPSTTPTSTPTTSVVPTSTPSASPTSTPSFLPSVTSEPSAAPSLRPSVTPTSTPSSSPTSTPTSTPSALPTSTPSASPSSTPSLRPSVTSEPSTTPSVSPSVLPTASPSTSTQPSIAPTVSSQPSSSPTEGCKDDPQDWFTLSNGGVDCEWYEEDPEQRCQEYGDDMHIAFNCTAKEACCACGGGCNDDRFKTVFVEDTGREEPCVWLAARMDEFSPSLNDDYSVLCNDVSPEGFGGICKETCGKCYDSIFDSPDELFLYEGIPRDCLWLSLRTDVQDELCHDRESDAFQTCPEACTLFSVCNNSPELYEDSNGNTCGYYQEIRFERCTDLGDVPNADGITPNEACCICGGGRDKVTNEPSASPTSLCNDHPNDWFTTGIAPEIPGGAVVDCSWYAENVEERCQDQGKQVDFLGYTANEACCACGGGCNDDRFKTVFVPDTGREEPCVWLAARMDRYSYLCDDETEAGFGGICKETCGKCYDTVTDSIDGIFLYEGIPRDCLWLSLRTDVQDELCHDRESEAFRTCTESCTLFSVCDDDPNVFFEDRLGNNCSYYQESRYHRCRGEGSIPNALNVTANEACCICGGGVDKQSPSSR